MEAKLNQLIADYDQGTISRRSLMAMLAALVLAPKTVPAQAAGFSAQSLNHVTLAVTDIDRSRAFYESVLGSKLVSTQSNGINLGLGHSFLGLYKIPTPPGIHHFCVGIDNFDVQASADKLRKLGLDPYVREDKPEVYFQDPDGITVQLEDKNYRG